MARKQYFLTIDSGGSNIKCAIFDSEGSELASVSAIPETSSPHDGYVERRADAVWDCCCGVIRAALARSGLDSRDISAISLCGYGGGICLCDSSGKAVSPVIVSTDTRAAEELAALRSSGRADEIFAVSHQQPWEGQAAPMLNWFCTHERDILARARYALCIKDYIRLRLTGEASGEITDSSNLNIIDPKTAALSPELLRLGGIAELVHLFDYPIRLPHSHAGSVSGAAAEDTGLRIGTPVAAGLYDVSACTMGCGCLSSESMAVTIGTWAMAAYFDTDYSHADKNTIVTASAMKDRFLLEQGSATGTANLNWFLRSIISPMHPRLDADGMYALCSKVISEKSPAERDVFFVPYLFASCGHPSAKGGFFNLSANRSAEDMLYAVLEGIMFSAMHHIRLLCCGNRRFERIALAGGAAASNEWSQMLCDMLQLPVSIMCGKQQGARGAAMCAGIVSGAFADYKQAADAMAKTEKVLLPRKEYVAVWTDKAAKYEKILQSLDEYYNATQKEFL